MRRRLFTIASAASLLLCAGLIFLWARSWIDGLTVADGKLVVFHIGDDPDGKFVALQRDWAHRSTAGIWHALRKNAKEWHEWLGFEFGGGKSHFVIYQPGLRLLQNGQSVLYFDDLNVTTRLVAIPVWPLALVLAILPCVWFTARHRERQRRAGGRCLTCGYDLRGNTSGVCPECGAVVRSGPVIPPDA